MFFLIITLLKFIITQHGFLIIFLYNTQRCWLNLLDRFEAVFEPPIHEIYTNLSPAPGIGSDNLVSKSRKLVKFLWTRSLPASNDHRSSLFSFLFILSFIPTYRSSFEFRLFFSNDSMTLRESIIFEEVEEEKKNHCENL